MFEVTIGVGIFVNHGKIECSLLVSQKVLETVNDVRARSDDFQDKQKNKQS